MCDSSEIIDRFGSYKSHLIELLRSFSGDIRCIEFGIGNISSKIFNDFAKNNINFEIDSYEFDLKWYQLIKHETYALKNHRFHYVDKYNKIPYNVLLNNKYDLIFLDQGKDIDGFNNRIYVLNKMINNSKNFMLHNCDLYDINIFKKYAEKFNMVFFNDILPPTLLLSRR